MYSTIFIHAMIRYFVEIVNKLFNRENKKAPVPDQGFYIKSNYRDVLLVSRQVNIAGGTF